MKKGLVFLCMILFFGVCLQATNQSKPAAKVDPKKTFAFTGRGDYIYLYNRTTKESKNTGVKGDDPSLSPDGEKIVFAIVESYTGGIFIMDVDGSNRKKVTKGSYEGVMRYPQWSSDGKKIFFIANRWNKKNRDGYEEYEWFDGIYVINIDGTEESYIKKTENSYFDLSPDGKKIIFGDSGL